MAKKKQVEDAYIFSQETIDSLQELGKVLFDIHKRLLSEGYEIDTKAGTITAPTPEVLEKRKREKKEYERRKEEAIQKALAHYRATGEIVEEWERFLD